MNVKLNFGARYTLLMAGETSAASLRCVSPLASGSTVVGRLPWRARARPSDIATPGVIARSGDNASRSGVIAGAGVIAGGPGDNVV